MSRGAHAGVRQRLLARLQRAVDQLADELLQLRARDADRQVLRALGVCRDERQVDLGLLRRRQLDLRALGRFLEPLQRHAVLRQVDALVAFELGDQVVDEHVVEVVSAEERVAVRGLDLERALAQLQHRDVEGAATEVVDRDGLVGLLVETVRQRRRRRLVDDAQHLEAGDAAGVARRLPLGVVEVRGDGDHRLGHLLAEVGLGVRLQLLQDHRADLRRRVLPAAHLDDGVAVGRALDGEGRDRLEVLHLVVLELAAHQPLHRVDRVVAGS